MVEDLSCWLDITMAQGDPENYSKTDLEMWVMRIFNRLPFKAGKSNREKRRSFQELWEAADGRPELVAYGLNASIKFRKFSVVYAKACMKNYGVGATITSKPVEIPKIKHVEKIVTKARSASKPKTTRKRKPAIEAAPDIEWK